MRKVIAVLIMACAVGFFVIHVMNTGEKKTEDIKQSDVQTELDKYQKELTDNYPALPGDVMEIYNQLLQVAYSGQMTDAEAGQYVDIIRLMYSDGFNQLNPRETQLKSLIQDLNNNKQNHADIVGSQIRNVYILKDENGEQTEATVDVEHVMNASAVARKYLFVNENNKWKINGWNSGQEGKTEE